MCLIVWTVSGDSVLKALKNQIQMPKFGQCSAKVSLAAEHFSGGVVLIQSQLFLQRGLSDAPILNCTVVELVAQLIST